MSSWKKFLRGVMAVMIVISMLPISAFAEMVDPTEVVSEDGVAIDESNFPDPIFRDYVKTNFDADYDGYLSQVECDSVQWIIVYDMGITSLQGIEYFTKMMDLNCSDNELTELDVSKNPNLRSLICENNELTGLDVSKNPNLEGIHCYSNHLAELNVSQNSKLEYIGCFGNELIELDVSKNSNLVSLDCRDNQLVELNVSQNSKLEDLSCEDNKLTELDVSKNPNLESLSCGYNKLTELDVSKNLNLVSLNCSFNQLAELDVSQNSKLESLNCEGNPLTELDVSQNFKLESFSCGGNPLTELDVSKNLNLVWLGCNYNQLAELDVSQNSKLESLYCGNNELTELDISQNSELESLYCGNNELIELDVSQNFKLENLSCAENELTELNVSQNSKLESLYCGWNELIKLDVSKNLNLVSLSCRNNQLVELNVSQNSKLEDIDCIYNQLTHLDISNQPDLEGCNASENRSSVHLAVDRTLDLTTIPGFDPVRATNWVGGNVSGNTLTVDTGVTELTFTYDMDGAIGNKSETFTWVVNVPAHEHRYTECIVKPEALKKTATCTDNAVYYKSCSCGQVSSNETDIFDVENSALGHSYGEWQHDMEHHWKKCACGDKIEEGVHKTKLINQKDATCTKDGYTGDKVCATCDAIIENGVTIPATGHTIEIQSDKDATCTENGYSGDQVCTICKQVVKKGTSITATGHSFGNWVITKEATEKETGLKERTCINCTFKETEEIPVLDHTHSYSEWQHDMEHHWKECACGDRKEEKAHNLKVRNQKDATCTEDGYTGDKVCVTCDAIIENGVVAPAKGHTFGEWTIVKEATETKTGLKERVCSTCHFKESKEIPTLNHQHVYSNEWQYNAKNHWRECVCGEKTQKEGHKIEVENRKDVTCTENGYTGNKVCVVCHNIVEIGKVIPAKGHSYGNWIVKRKPTVLVTGIEIRTCSVCGAKEQKVTDKLPAFIKLNAKTISLKVKQKTTAVEVSMQKGDKIKSWKSNKPNIASVDKKGKITGRKPGTAKITVTLASGKKAILTVKVQKSAVKTTKITLNKRSVTLKKGKTFKLQAALTPITSVEKVKFSTSNKKVATVNSKGTIKAKKNGKATITVRSGKKKVTCKVTVK